MSNTKLALLVPAFMLATTAGCSTTTGEQPAAGPSTSSVAQSSPEPGGTCTKAGGLSVALGGDEGGAGHRRVVLTLTNTSGAACRLTGYPGVAALDAGGRQLAQARRTERGYMSGPTPVRTVEIAAGGSAQAVVEGLGAKPDGSGCTDVAGLLVTAPDDTESTRLDWHTDTCPDLEVHPVTTGNG